MKKEFKKIVNEITDKSIELLNRDSEDEMTGVVIRLAREIEKTENSKAMLELSILTVLKEMKDDKNN